MQSTNPSHILIARNSRSPNHAGGPSGSISFPEVDPAAASGVFRSASSASSTSSSGVSSPPWGFDGSSGSDRTTTEIEFASAEDLEAEDAIVIDETFSKRAKWPGTVKIIVEKTTFW